MYFCKATIFMACKEYKKAISFFRKTLKTKPYNIEIYFFESYRDIGECLYQLEEYDLAIISFKLALKRNPRSFKIHYTLGLINKHFDRYDQAIQNFIEANKINPYHKEGVDNLKFCHCKKIQEESWEGNLKESQNKDKIIRKKILISDICNKVNTDFDIICL